MTEIPNTYTVATTLPDGNFNAIIEDQRNIVVISEDSPNTVVVTVPGVTATVSRASIVYGNGVPWEIEVEI